MVVNLELRQHPKVKEWLEQFDKTQQSKKAVELDRFLKFLGKTVDQILQDFKDSEDKNAWSRQMGAQVLKFYNKIISEGAALNTARSLARAKMDA